MRGTALGLSLLAVLMSGATGCKVRVDKSGDGGEDNVKIATPFGGISVNKDQTSPAELGLPAYPGAVAEAGGDGNRSAKVDLGFGDWKLRVKMAHFTTADNQSQVLAFYRKALSEYGVAIECAGDKPAAASPAATGEGLTCDYSDHGNASPHGSYSSGDLELKAGSKRHQHIVIVERGNASATRFSLIELDLPHGFDSEQQGTN
jgi:hypothetical protein